MVKNSKKKNPEISKNLKKSQKIIFFLKKSEFLEEEKKN